MRHVIICLADADDAALAGLGDVELICLNRHLHGAVRTHWRLVCELRRLRPAVLQTYNIGTLEYAVTGALAGVPRRIHAEHGRGLSERRGDHKKYNFLRRALAPFIATYVTVSDDLVTWLADTVGIPAKKIRLIRNGIDLNRFQPGPRIAAPFVVGTVGRLDAIKAQSDLIKAFALLRTRAPDKSSHLRLAIVGAGPLHGELAAQIEAAGLGDCTWLPGPRRDIADIMQTFTVFVLPSLSEASPITLMEAMASGVPVVASRVGGVPDLIGDDVRGILVTPGNVEELADAFAQYFDDPATRHRHADAARQYMIAHYDIETTAAAYAALYASG